MANNRFPSPSKGLMYTVTILRVSFLVALVAGLGDLFHWFPAGRTVVDLHIGAGIVLFAAVVGLYSAVKSRPAFISLVFVVIGGLVGLIIPGHGLGLGVLHLFIMLIAIGLAEMAGSQHKKKRRL